MARPTASDLAAYTGREVDDASVVRVMPVALELVDRYYVTDPWTVSCTEATLRVAAHLLTNQQHPLGIVGGDLGPVYLRTRLPDVDRLLTPRGGFA